MASHFFQNSGDNCPARDIRNRPKKTLSRDSIRTPNRAYPPETDAAREKIYLRSVPSLKPRKHRPRHRKLPEKMLTTGGNWPPNAAYPSETGCRPRKKLLAVCAQLKMQQTRLRQIPPAKNAKHDLYTANPCETLGTAPKILHSRAVPGPRYCHPCETQETAPKILHSRAVSGPRYCNPSETVDTRRRRQCGNCPPAPQWRRSPENRHIVQNPPRPPQNRPTTGRGFLLGVLILWGEGGREREGGLGFQYGRSTVWQNCPSCSSGSHVWRPVCLLQLAPAVSVVQLYQLCQQLQLRQLGMGV